MVTEKNIGHESNFKKNVKCCPIKIVMGSLGKKWVVTLIRDLFMGKKKYGDFLEANPKLSGKVLSERLRDLEQEGIIRKKIVSKTPLKAVYELTEKGKDLGRVLYELVMFSVRNYSKKVFKKPFSYDEKTCSLLVKQTFGIK